MLHAWWVSSFLQASLLRMSSFRNGTKQNFRHKWLHQTIEPLFLSLSRNGALSFKVQKPARKKAAPIECIDKRASERAT